MSSDTVLFLVLGGSFLAVGAHLFLWSRRTRAKIQRFARQRCLVYTSTDREGLEERLNTVFGLEVEEGGARGFSRVRDLVSFDGGTLFRTTQVLDVTQFSTAANAHAAIAAVMAAAPQAVNLRGIFQLIPGSGIRQCFPLEGTDQSSAVLALLQTVGMASPPCTLTISFAQGKALAYMEPKLVGSVTLEHLDFLLRLGQAFSKRDPESG